MGNLTGTAAKTDTESSSTVASGSSSAILGINKDDLKVLETTLLKTLVSSTFLVVLWFSIESGKQLSAGTKINSNQN